MPTQPNPQITRGHKTGAHATSLSSAVAFDFAFDSNFDSAFDSAFDLHPLLRLPIVQDRKWIKKALLSEPKASFKAFPFFVLHNWGPEGQWQRGRLFWVTFFGEAKKVTSCRATPDLQTQKSQQHFAKRRKKSQPDTQITRGHKTRAHPTPPHINSIYSKPDTKHPAPQAASPSTENSPANQTTSYHAT